MAATATIAGPPPGLGPPRSDEAANNAATEEPPSPSSLRHSAHSGPPQGTAAGEQSGAHGKGSGGGKGHNETHSHHHHHHHHQHHHRQQQQQQHQVPTGVPVLSDTVVAKRIMPGAKDQTYFPSLMLALYESKLVEPPPGMPKLSEWYGDWEPAQSYTRRAGQSGHGAMSGGMPHSPMGSFGKTDRMGRGGSGLATSMGAASGATGFDEVGDGAGYSTAFNKRDRFRKGEEGALPMRYGETDTSRRSLNTGKNPFGQVSATGAFKPAGREIGAESLNDKRGLAMGGRLGRDRDGLSQMTGQRNGREPITQKDRRARANADDGIDGDEWESVARSPEGDRRNRPGYIADNASDWRKAGSAGERGLGRGAARNERDTGRKTSFPAWMAEDSEPAWMASDHQGSSDRARTLETMDDGDVDNVDTTGMDSIQAFKARMKEKERRERERVQGTSSTMASANPAGPPPGLALPGQTTQTPEHPTLSQQDDSSSHVRNSEQKSREAAPTGAGTEHASVEPPSLPGRASRFARFFDGKPQAAALAAQQKSVGGLAGTSTETTESPLAHHSAHVPPPPSDGAATQQQGGNMADFFRAMSVSREQQQQQQRHEESPKPSRFADAPPMQRNPSEADVQSMQKIMALLNGGARGEKEGGSQAHSKPPPGLALGALQRQGPPGDRASPVQRHESPAPSFPPQQYHSHASPAMQAHSPAPTHGEHPPQHRQESMHGPPSDWHSPPPSFEGQRGLPGFGPPPPGLDPRMMAGPRPQLGGMPHGLPPHVAMMLGGGGQGTMGALPQGVGRGFPPGMRPGGPPPPLPPHVQQQLASMPPQAQHHFLAQHFGGPSSPFGGGMPPLPPPPPGMQQHQHPMHGPMYGNASSSPMSHMYGGGSGAPNFGSQVGENSNSNSNNNSGGGGGGGNSHSADGAAHLMALLGHGGTGAK